MSIRTVEVRCPLDRIVAIVGFVTERLEHALRIETSSNILNDDDDTLPRIPRWMRVGSLGPECPSIWRS